VWPPRLGLSRKDRSWSVLTPPGSKSSLARDPTIAFPVHVILLPNNGIHIVENVRTDLIAAAAQKTGRATFFLAMTVPKAVGLTGTFVAPEAVR
jgi:hypothetical protein